MIFLEAVEAARGVTEGFAFDLAATCSRWRTISLHSPRIWTSVQCTLDKVDGEASERRWAAYLQTFLDRACQLPLDVYLDYNGGNCPLHVELLTTIRALFRRSRTFEFVTSHAFDDEEVVGFLSEEAPRLTHLSVNRGDHGFVDDDIFELTLALCAPRLVTFEFSGFALHFATDRRIPSVEKAKLYLVGELPSDIPALIANFPRLVELDLTVETDLSLSTFVLAQHLRYLRLFMLAGSFDMDVVQSLRLPSLQTAHISITESDSFAQNVLGAFIASCLATVEVLRLDFDLVPGAAWYPPPFAHLINHPKRGVYPDFGVGSRIRSAASRISPPPSRM
ncbi:hypothetical protein EXIGLDRAFT_731806 [Exidia glandulosa HHB12029]|uniref:F-box domain-containing protein n=1 Tax=Exidia glandulosa HHB12029 TaxID=1314781 RepID=A0A165BR05_EXIGL|nr:hypothetical protein EXIGLDRAFT_731806 [Exidia glandulosa HHB12029]